MPALRMSVRTMLILIVPAALASWLAVGVRSARTAARESQCFNNPYYTYVQLLNYRSTYGHYPRDVSSRLMVGAMHSWRAVLHAYERTDNFAAVYDLTQPWNSPGNLVAARVAPNQFVCPNNCNNGVRTTSYVAVIEDGISSLDRADALPREGPEVSRQVLLLEVPNSDIVWTEPRDLDVADLSRLDPTGDPDGIMVVFADGATRRMKVEAVRALFRR